jgi:hypothetical protein
MGEGVGVDEILSRQGGIITRAQAVAAGMKVRRIHSLLEAGKWQIVFEGVYSVRKPDFLALVRAMVLWCGGIASHCCAAALLGFDAFEYLTCLEITSRRDVRHEDVFVRTGRRLDAEQVVEIDGIRLTTPARTLLDLGEVVHLDDVEVAIDCCLRRGDTTWEDLQKLVDESKGGGRKGPAVLRRILKLRAHQKQHTDSPLETRFLQLTRYARLPRPTLQFPVAGALAHADFAWPEKNLLAETLGEGAHRGNQGQLERDSARDNRVSHLKTFTVLRFTWSPVNFLPMVVCSELARGLGLTWKPSANVRKAIEAFRKRNMARAGEWKAAQKKAEASGGVGGWAAASSCSTLWAKLRSEGLRKAGITGFGPKGPEEEEEERARAL